MKAFPVAALCSTMRVSRSGFYAFIRRETSPVNGAQVKLEADAKDIFGDSGKTYGSRRMLEELNKVGHDVGRYRTRSLMKKLDLRVISAKRFKVTTDSKHNHPVAPNLLNRQFDVDHPDTAWVGDITYSVPSPWRHQDNAAKALSMSGIHLMNTGK